MMKLFDVFYYSMWGSILMLVVAGGGLSLIALLLVICKLLGVI